MDVLISNSYNHFHKLKDTKKFCISEMSKLIHYVSTREMITFYWKTDDRTKNFTNTKQNNNKKHLNLLIIRV